ncbi:hypothetical protein FS749_013032 [Ceratobasidium sp. UAMH 11750]|nr:hypothetical protein FS749_013032 [Ceratobasidium sp. UAMH 11750]
MRSMPSKSTELDRKPQQCSSDVHLFFSLLQLAMVADHLDMADNSSQQAPYNPVESWGATVDVVEYDGSGVFTNIPGVDLSGYPQNAMYAGSHAPPSPTGQRASKRPAYGEGVHSGIDTMFQADDVHVVTPASHAF